MKSLMLVGSLLVASSGWGTQNDKLSAVAQSISRQPELYIKTFDKAKESEKLEIADAALKSTDRFVKMTISEVMGSLPSGSKKVMSTEQFIAFASMKEKEVKSAADVYAHIRGYLSASCTEKDKTTCAMHAKYKQFPDELMAIRNDLVEQMAKAKPEYGPMTAKGVDPFVRWFLR